jgi:tRNA threonylcarbamoyladenosine biosynthesis protein TsaE
MQTTMLKDENATLSLGARLSALLRTGDVVALTGGLGAGKTTLARGVVKALCGDLAVPSPTYTLVQTYDTPYGELWHCDMYRLERPEDAWELGLMDAFEDAICLIEWPDKLGHLLPKDALLINIDFDGDGRKAVLTGWEDKLDAAG